MGIIQILIQQNTPLEHLVKDDMFQQSGSKAPHGFQLTQIAGMVPSVDSESVSEWASVKKADCLFSPTTDLQS